MNSVFGRSFVSVLSCIVNRQAVIYDRIGKKSQLFSDSMIGDCSVKEFIIKIQVGTNCSAECFLIALIYMDILFRKPGCFINSKNANSVILVASMVAAKFNDDTFRSNARYAKIAGISVEELNAMEIEFVRLMSFSLVVSCETFQNYFNEVYNHANKVCTSCMHYELPILTVSWSHSDTCCMLSYAESSERTIAISGQSYRPMSVSFDNYPGNATTQNNDLSSVSSRRNRAMTYASYR